MDQSFSILTAVLEFYRSLPATYDAKGWIRTFAMALFFYAFIWAMERAYGTRTDNYQSRNFLHDLSYWIFGKGPLWRPVILGVFAVLIAPESGLLVDPPPFAKLPFAAQVILYLIVNDFLYYWWHRAAHHFEFLWAFHAMHHSQERLTFASSGRFHPVEQIAANFFVVIPGIILGLNGLLPLALLIFVIVQAEIEHSQIPWRFGPFYFVFVSPVYHSYHHGVDPEYHDKHFGQTFVVWDHLFGTAVKRGVPPPTTFGVTDMNPRSFADTLVEPFRLLKVMYFKRKSG